MPDDGQATKGRAMMGSSVRGKWKLVLPLATGAIAIAAFSEYAGAKPKDPNDPRKGITGGSIAGHPIKIVAVGCGSDSADLAIKETKRIVEQNKADIMIGPLSGDESVAIAQY